MKQQIKLLYLLLPLLILNTWKGQAQWTKQDSIWLKNVLEGKDSLRLNPEFMKEMQEGLFLNPKQPAGEQQTAPRELPITKDFSEYMPYSDNPNRKVPLNQLPPNVFWRHMLPLDPTLPISKSLQDEFRQKPARGNSGAVASFDIGQMTSRKEYIHRKNAKRDGTRQNVGRPLPNTAAQRAYQLQEARKKARIARQDSTRSKYFVGPIEEEY